MMLEFVVNYLYCDLGSFNTSRLRRVDHIYADLVASIDCKSFQEFIWFAVLFMQVEFMRNLEDRDDEYRTMLNEKLQMADDCGLIQVYSKELGNRLAS